MDKIVYIEWVDSTSLGGGVWKNKADLDLIDKLPIIRSIGFLLEETEDYIAISAHVGANQISGDMCVPKVAIRKRKSLNVRSK